MPPILLLRQRPPLCSILTRAWSFHYFADAATRPLACSSGHRQRFGQTPPLGQLEEVVDGADDGPLGAHFFEAAQQELAETAGLFDLSEHRLHHGGIKRRLAPFAAIGAGDFPETEIVSDQAQHKAGEMVLGHEVPHHRWQKQRLINLPGAECLAHAASWNLTRSSLASKICLILGQAPRRSSSFV